MTQQQKNKSIHIVYGLTLVISLGIFSLLLYETGKLGSLKVKVGNSELEMKLEEENLTTVKSMVDFLFQNEITARESKALLKEFENYYHSSDPTIVDAIERQEEQSEVSKKLRYLLQNLSGPFKRSTHQFYNIQDTQLVDAIKQLGYDHPVSKELRKLLNLRKGPFEDNAKEVFFSVPNGDGIPRGRAASCSENAFFRQEIRLFNRQRTKSISVYVSGSFPCPEISTNSDSEIGKLIQISYLDMKNLIGDSTIVGKEIGFADVMIDAL